MVDKDRIKGSAEQAKGKAKEVAGKVTGDSKLEGEGKADQVKGKVQNTIGGASVTLNGYFPRSVSLMPPTRCSRRLLDDVRLLNPSAGHRNAGWLEAQEYLSCNMRGRRQFRQMDWMLWNSHIARHSEGLCRP